MATGGEEGGRWRPGSASRSASMLLVVFAREKHRGLSVHERGR
jgi:hypothetical protein